MEQEEQEQTKKGQPFFMHLSNGGAFQPDCQRKPTSALGYLLFFREGELRILNACQCEFVIILVMNSKYVLPQTIMDVHVICIYPSFLFWSPSTHTHSRRRRRRRRSDIHKGENSSH